MPFWHFVLLLAFCFVIRGYFFHLGVSIGVLPVLTAQYFVCFYIVGCVSTQWQSEFLRASLPSLWYFNRTKLKYNHQSLHSQTVKRINSCFSSYEKPVVCERD